jgi:DNA-directed RNA polymerase subunit RPC12/RpoP
VRIYAEKTLDLQAKSTGGKRSRKLLVLKPEGWSMPSDDPGVPLGAQTLLCVECKEKIPLLAFSKRQQSSLEPRCPNCTGQHLPVELRKRFTLVSGSFHRLYGPF